MITRNLLAGTTSFREKIDIYDTSSSVGAGLSGLTYSSSGLAAYYIRDGETSTTSISLVTATLGTWTSGGFVEVDATHAKGTYEIGIPNAVIASGVKFADVFIYGATNALLVHLRYILDPVASNAIQVDSTALSTHASGMLPSDVRDISGSAVSTTTAQLGVNAVQVGGTAQTGRDIGASVLLSPGTGAGQISLASGAVTVGTNTDKTGYTASTVSDKTGYSLAASQTFNVTGDITGNLSGSVGSVTGNVGGNVVGSVASVSAAVTVGTNNDKTGYTVSTVSDKTGYALSTAGVSAVQSGLATSVEVAALPDASENATAVWGATTRTLSAGTNISLAKGTGITGFNDVSSADVNAACDTAISDAALATATALSAVKTDTAAILLDTGTDGVVIPQAQADKVWGTAARTLTAGTNIALAKGVGVTGFNDLSGADVRSAIGMASANLDTQIATIPCTVKKNTALAGFTFIMTDSTNHALAAGKTVTCTRKIDSGSFTSGTLANITDVGGGVYSVDFLAADLNGDIITLKASATDCDDTIVTLVTAK